MKNILFISMGNICRSPVAEAIFLERLKERDLTSNYKLDSAGTVDFHNGEKPDKRMIKAAHSRGYTLESFARGFDPRYDFDNFDMIISMDRKSLLDLREFDKEKKYRDKMYLISDYNITREEKDVPDPYYGGEQGFENVLDLLEDGVKGLLDKLENA